MASAAVSYGYTHTLCVQQRTESERASLSRFIQKRLYFSRSSRAPARSSISKTHT